jgi:hypothetical protein
VSTRFVIGDYVRSKVQGPLGVAFGKVTAVRDSGNLYPYEVQDLEQPPDIKRTLIFKADELEEIPYPEIIEFELASVMVPAAPASASTDCTCVSLINGHMPECTYPRKESA